MSKNNENTSVQPPLAVLVRRAAAHVLGHDPENCGDALCTPQDLCNSRGDLPCPQHAELVIRHIGDYAELCGGQFGRRDDQFGYILLAEGYLLYPGDGFSWLRRMARRYGPHVRRYVVTYLDRSMYQTMLGPAQGRRTYATAEDAQQHLQMFLRDNSEDRLAETYGRQSLGTFRVNSCRCYPEHYDPMQNNFSPLEEL